MKKPVPFHPVLMAVYPVLFLVAHNASEVVARSFLASMGVILVSMGVVWFLFFALCRNWYRGALGTSWFLALFFSFGHVLRLISGKASGISVGQRIVPLDLLILSLWGILFSLVAFLVIRSKADAHAATRMGNAFALLLICFPIFSLAQYQIREHRVPNPVHVHTSPALNNPHPEQEEATSATQMPDIYYVILDGYTNGEVLDKIFGFNNREFLDYLRAKGFHVVPHSRSNYPRTVQSLASSLNMGYLEQGMEGIDRNSTSMLPLRRLLNRNKVFQFLRHYHYTLVDIPCGYSLDDLKGSVDVYLAPAIMLGGFENELINSTPIPTVLSRFKHASFQYALRRETALREFRYLAESVEVRSPHFVFCHILLPHPPFTFGPKGEEKRLDKPYSILDCGPCGGGTNSVEEYREGYRDQVQFVNLQMRSVLDQMFPRLRKPSLIVLQGDHGSGSTWYQEDLKKTDVHERFSNLNAYYFSGFDYSQIGDETSPVNTFRIIFNHYFGTKYGLLSNESYFFTSERPYDFTNVTRRARARLDDVNPDNQ